MKDFVSLKFVRGLVVLSVWMLPLSVKAEEGTFHWLNAVGDFVKDGLGPARTAEDLAREENLRRQEELSSRSRENAAVAVPAPSPTSPSAGKAAGTDAAISKDVSARPARAEEWNAVRGKGEASSQVPTHAPAKDVVTPTPKPLSSVKPAAARTDGGATAVSVPRTPELIPPETASELSPLDDLPDDDGGAVKKDVGKVAAPTVRRPDARPPVGAPSTTSSASSPAPAQPVLPPVRRIAATATVDQALQAGGAAELYGLSPSK